MTRKYFVQIRFIKKVHKLWNMKDTTRKTEKQKFAFMCTKKGYNDTVCWITVESFQPTKHIADSNTNEHVRW